MRNSKVIESNNYDTTHELMIEFISDWKEKYDSTKVMISEPIYDTRINKDTHRPIYRGIVFWDTYEHLTKKVILFDY